MHSVKLKGMDENRTSSSIIHTKYLERNRSYTARLEYLQIRRGNTDDGPHEVQPPAMEKLGSTILSIDKSTKLPVFPPFGTAELKNKWFMRSRLVALLRSDLWHHLIENRDLLVALVSKTLSRLPNKSKHEAESINSGLYAAGIRGHHPQS